MSTFPEELYNRIAQHRTRAEDKVLWTAELQAALFIFYSRLTDEEKIKANELSAQIISDNAEAIELCFKFLALTEVHATA